MAVAANPAVSDVNRRAALTQPSQPQPGCTLGSGEATARAVLAGDVAGHEDGQLLELQRDPAEIGKGDLAAGRVMADQPQFEPVLAAVTTSSAAAMRPSGHRLRQLCSRGIPANRAQGGNRLLDVRRR